MAGEGSGEESEMPPGEAEWRRAGFRVQSGYWWYYGGIGAYVPFAALYFRELGFSGFQVGALSALLPLGAAIAGPAGGALADTRGLHRTILRVALAGGMLAALAATQVSAFLPLALLIALLAICYAPVAPMLDSYSVTISDRLGVSYGWLRVWGSAGFMAMVLVVGRVMGERADRFLFVATAIGIGAALVSLYGLPHLAERQAHTFISGIGRIRRNRPLLLLLLIALMSAGGSTILNIYLGIHLQEVSGSVNLVGPAFAISAGSELPVIALGGWFLRHVRPQRLIALALLVYAIRFTAFGLIDNAAWLLAFQTLHGLSYGLFLLASVTLAHRLAGPAQSATAQALLTAMSFGFGSIAGSLIGGALLDSVGTAGLFRGAAMLMMVTLGVLFAGDRLIGFSQPASADGTTARRAA